MDSSYDLYGWNSHPSAGCPKNRREGIHGPHEDGSVEMDRHVIAGVHLGDGYRAACRANLLVHGKIDAAWRGKRLRDFVKEDKLCHSDVTCREKSDGKDDYSEENDCFIVPVFTDRLGMVDYAQKKEVEGKTTLTIFLLP